MRYSDSLRSNRGRDDPRDDRIREIRDRERLQREQARRKPRVPEQRLWVTRRVLRTGMGILRGPRNPCKRCRGPRYTRSTPPLGSWQSSRTSGTTGSETVIAR